MDYEKEIRHMLRTLADNPNCGYIKNLVRLDNLRDGKRERVQLLVEVDKDDLLD